MRISPTLSGLSWGKRSENFEKCMSTREIRVKKVKIRRTRIHACAHHTPPHHTCDKYIYKQQTQTACVRMWSPTLYQYEKVRGARTHAYYFSFLLFASGSKLWKTVWNLRSCARTHTRTHAHTRWRTRWMDRKARSRFPSSLASFANNLTQAPSYIF